MRLKDYVENPMGRGDAALGQNRIVLKGMLEEKFKRLTKKKDIKMNCYNAGRNTYLIHLIIPTETERTNSYDVVFEFTGPKELTAALSLTDYDVRVFANSPSFAYTFAYVYAKNDLLIKNLTKRLGKEFVKISPDIRNRYQIVNYEKYVFFGAMYILESGILSKKRFEKEAKAFIPTNYPGKIRTLEQIMKEYSDAEAKVRKERKKEKERQAKEVAKQKKEIRHIKSGLSTIEPRKKTMGHASSSIKPVKKMGHVMKKK